MANVGDKTRFGIFSPVSGIKKNVPIILTLTPDNMNVQLKDGKIIRRRMRKATLLNAETKVQTPDANPIIRYHTFIKRSTGTQYVLAFTKAHIYQWNTATLAFDTKFTCSADCENWETVNYNDKVVATNNVDKVLVWDTTGNFVALDDTTNGIEYSAGVYLTKAKYVTTFENYLILGYTYESGASYPQRVRWNDIGDETNWLTGNKGSVEIGQADKITGFGHYQGFLIIFKETSHYKVWLVGVPYIFNALQLSNKVGCQCSGSIINDSKGRLYWYSSEGTFKEITAGTISDDIQTDIVAKIEPDSVELIKSVFLDNTEEVCWSIPYSNALNNLLIIFKEGKWLLVDLAIPSFGGFKEA